MIYFFFFICLRRSDANHVKPFVCLKWPKTISTPMRRRLSFNWIGKKNQMIRDSTYQHRLTLNYAADRTGQSLVQIFQSLVYMWLHWSDTNGTWAGMSSCHTPITYRLTVVPISERNSDTIPKFRKIEGEEKDKYGWNLVGYIKNGRILIISNHISVG